MADQEKKKADYKAGRTIGTSGRQMFEFNPDLVLADDDEAQEGELEREDDDDEKDDAKVKDINEQIVGRDGNGNGQHRNTSTSR